MRAAAKEISLMLQDIVMVEESHLIGGGTRKNIGWVRGFPDAHTHNFAGDASKIEIVVTDGPDVELPVIYTLKSRFPVRRDVFARIIARVPKEATIESDMADVRITRLSRATILK